MKKLIYFSSMLLVIISAFLFRCTKEKDNGNQEREISFSIMTPDTKNGLEIKGASGYSLSDAKKIVLTIQNADGSPTRYSSSEVTIYEMNGVFFSQKLMLKAGSFRLTEFFLMDGGSNIIFAAPLTGSFESQFVAHPLPIPFNVNIDVNTPVVVEVLSTENTVPADFGLVSFQISQVNVIDFLITVADRDINKLLSAKLTVSAGTFSYLQMLDSVAANRVIIKDSAGIDFYNLTIEKNGYFTYSHDYPKDSLKLFNSSGNNTPLLIELEKDNSPILTIGEHYGGGIVYYVYDNGRHGLIASTTDQYGSRWYAGTYILTGANGVGVGAGKLNTALIITSQGYGDGETYAARMCGEYSVTIGDTVYDDWYLPSQHELDLLLSEKEVVGASSDTLTFYWSSTESDITHAYMTNFIGGGYIFKGNSAIVRAIREF